MYFTGILIRLKSIEVVEYLMITENKLFVKSSEFVLKPFQALFNHKAPDNLLGGVTPDKQQENNP